MLLIFFISLFILLVSALKMEKEKIYCISIIIFAFVCYSLNEILSLLYKLDYKHLFWIYLIASIVLLFFSARNLSNNAHMYNEKLILWIKHSTRNIYVWIFMAVFVAVFFLALYTVPYNWDSMTYHLPRIAHWAQNGSIAHFATGDVRQITSPPLSEFVNLQVYIFSGQKDDFLNLLQYSCFVTNAVLLYFITKSLGASKVYCWLSTFLFVSMPIAFGEALNTQVDHFSTMWLLIFVYFLLDLLHSGYCLRKNKENIRKVIILSSCIGFGYLAKPSILFAIVIFASWLLGVCIRRKEKVQDILVLLGIASGVILLIVLPEVARNVVTFGAISHSEAGAKQLIGTYNPVYVVVNAVKNLAMNVPNNYISVDGFVEHLVYWIAYILKVEINSPAIAENGTGFFLHQAGEYGHDTAVNPVILFFVVFAVMWLIVRRIKKERVQFAEIYSWIAILSFVVFCFVLRWEPYVTRYMVSYLALLCPVVGVWLFEMKKRTWANMISGVLLFVSVLEFCNLLQYHGEICKRQNEITNRESAYYEVYREEEKYFVELKRILEELKFDSVGVCLSIANTYEYPIWAMIDKDVRIEHILTDNEATKYEDDEFVPEIIVVMRKNDEDIVNYKEHTYRCYERIDDDKSVWVLSNNDINQ